MSGIACIVVASGNKTIAFADSFRDAALQPMPEANMSAAFARTLCTFAGTYDPVATPAQQQKATEIMGKFNSLAVQIDCSHRFRIADQVQAELACNSFNDEARPLIDQILANP